MKSLLKLASLALLILLSSCKKDNNDDSSDITGTWSVTGVECPDGTSIAYDPGYPPETTTFTVVGKDYNVLLTFNSDGSFTSSGYYTAVLTTDVDGHSFTSEYPFNKFLNTGTWSIDGNNLMASNGTSSTTFTIDEQTNSKLILISHISATEDYGGGAYIKSSCTYKYTLTR